jgi:SAM-dependent methyltransferase
MTPAAYVEMAETESHHWWFAGRRDIVANEIRRLDLPPGARILEVGCGTGGNLDMLSRFGSVSALEMNEMACEIARSRWGNRFDIRAGSCPDRMPAYEHKFDLICLLDVLEHIEDDIGTLDALKGLLNEGGHVLVTVPAYRWLWSPHDEFLHHKRRYTIHELKRKSAVAGLVVQRSSYFNTLLFPLAAAVRVKDRLLSRRIGSGSAIPVEPLNGLLWRAFSAERHLLDKARLPFGLSLFAVMGTGSR